MTPSGPRLPKETVVAPSAAPIFAYAARRAQQDPAYLGWVLHAYQKAEGFTVDAMAGLLGGRLADLDRLWLCLRPRPQFFAADVLAVADHIGIDPAALARVVRLVDAVAQMKDGTPDAHRGLLIAARTRGKGEASRTETAPAPAGSLSNPQNLAAPSARQTPKPKSRRRRGRRRSG